MDEIDVIFAVETDTSLDLLGLLVDKKSLEVTAWCAYEFEAALTFVYPIKFEHVELSMADLALVSLIAFVDALVYQFFKKHFYFVRLYYTLNHRSEMIVCKNVTVL